MSFYESLNYGEYFPESDLRSTKPANGIIMYVVRSNTAEPYSAVSMKLSQMTKLLPHRFKSAGRVIQLNDDDLLNVLHTLESSYAQVYCNMLQFAVFGTDHTHN